MSQADLARRIGTNRYWVIGMERGNDAADLGLMLRAVKALGLWLDLGSGGRSSAASGVEAVDIDAIVDAARAKS